MAAAFPGEHINWVTQVDRRGTGHAVLQALPAFAADARVMILVGDVPLITSATLSALAAVEADLTVLTVELDNPTGYGRIIRDATGDFLEIVEERDASDAQRRVREISTGIMVASAERLSAWLPQLTDDNDQQEFLLPDIIKIARAEGARVSTCLTENPLEVTGVNTFAQLAELERGHQLEQAKKFMGSGVHIIDPNRFDVRGDAEIGRDTVIDVNVILEGKVAIGEGVRIGPNVVIKDATIGAGSEIKANTHIDGAILEENCSAGPFARLRPGTYLCRDVAIGNFVEVKKSKLGVGTKASHLAYLGDSTLGSSVNIGAGTITCNYDGVNKWETHIGNDVFVGSNTSLVAPVSVGAGSTTGAGSTITKDVPEGVLAVGRGRQTTIAGWKRPEKKST